MLQGKLAFVSTENCRYNFEWKTSAVCSEEVLVVQNTSCIIQDPETHTFYNLSAFESRSHQVRYFVFTLYAILFKIQISHLCFG